MKKFISGFALLSCFTLMLSGCGGGEAPAGEGGENEALQFEADDQLYAVAYAGPTDADELTDYVDQYLGGDMPSTVHISDGEYYLVIPRYDNMDLVLYEVDTNSNEKSILLETNDPFIVQCNVSDIVPDSAIAVTSSGGDSDTFTPSVSLKDGEVLLGDHGMLLALG